MYSDEIIRYVLFQKIDIRSYLNLKQFLKLVYDLFCLRLLLACMLNGTLIVFLVVLYILYIYILSAERKVMYK